MALIEAVGLQDLMLLQIDIASTGGYANRDLFHHIKSHISRDDVMRIHVQAYSPLVTNETAHQIAQGYRTADGRKAVAAELFSWRMGGKAVKLPAADTQAIKRFNTTSAARQFKALQAQGMAASNEAMKAWASAYQTNLLRNAVRAMDDYYAGLDLHAKSAPVSYAPPAVGIPAIDKWIQIFARVTARRQIAEWQMLADLEALGLNEFMQADKLASPATVTRQLAAMEQVDIRNDVYFQELDAAFKEFSDAAMMLNASAILRDPALEKHIDVQRAYGEKFAKHNRAFLGAIRRVLVFADQRRGKLSASDGKLMLSSREDVAIYNAYMDQVKQETQAVDTMLAAQASLRASQLGPAR